MICMSHPSLETKLKLYSDSPLVLVVESPHQYYRMVCDLTKEFDGDVSDFSCWDGLARVRGDKVGELLCNHFSFELADKRMVALLHKQLGRNFLNGTHLVEFNKINGEIDLFLHDLCATVDFAVDSAELQLDDLLKACSVRPAKVYQSFLEKVICYINMFVALRGVEFFVFVGLKSVLDDDDLAQLYKHCTLAKVSLLLVESCKQRPLLPDERAVIVTDDLCEITENIVE